MSVTKISRVFHDSQKTRSFSPTTRTYRASSVSPIHRLEISKLCHRMTADGRKGARGDDVPGCVSAAAQSSTDPTRYRIGIRRKVRCIEFFDAARVGPPIDRLLGTSALRNLLPLTTLFHSLLRPAPRAMRSSSSLFSDLARFYAAKTASSFGSLLRKLLHARLTLIAFNDTIVVTVVICCYFFIQPAMDKSVSARQGSF